jgi:hypothetical protein
MMQHREHDDRDHRDHVDEDEPQLLAAADVRCRSLRRGRRIELGPGVDQNPVHQRQQQPRDHARDQQVADVGAAERREQHRERRGRDDHSQPADAHDRPD